MSPSLVLFDIDGTLVRKAGPQHRLALIQAVRDVLGLETTTEGVPLHGMLDPDIIRCMLENAGFASTDIDAAMPAILIAAEEAYLATESPDIRDKRCPAVPEILDILAGRGTVLALVTGNLPRIGWRKLEKAGIHQYFRHGGFGGMAPTRGLLAKLAIEQARADGLIAQSARISLIGDAPQDIRAAQENGIQSISVRTGVTPPGELEACNPDCLLDDLTMLDPNILF